MYDVGFVTFDLSVYTMHLARRKTQKKEWLSKFYHFLAGEYPPMQNDWKWVFACVLATLLNMQDGHRGNISPDIKEMGADWIYIRNSDVIWQEKRLTVCGFADGALRAKIPNYKL